MMHAFGLIYALTGACIVFALAAWLMEREK